MLKSEEDNTILPLDGVEEEGATVEVEILDDSEIPSDPEANTSDQKGEEQGGLAGLLGKNAPEEKGSAVEIDPTKKHPAGEPAPESPKFYRERINTVNRQVKKKYQEFTKQVQALEAQKQEITSKLEEYQKLGTVDQISQISNAFQTMISRPTEWKEWLRQSNEPAYQNLYKALFGNTATTTQNDIISDSRLEEEFIKDNYESLVEAGLWEGEEDENGNIVRGADGRIPFRDSEAGRKFVRMQMKLASKMAQQQVTPLNNKLATLESFYERNKESATQQEKKQIEGNDMQNNNQQNNNPVTPEVDTEEQQRQLAEKQLAMQIWEICRDAVNGNDTKARELMDAVRNFVDTNTEVKKAFDENRYTTVVSLVSKYIYRKVSIPAKKSSGGGAVSQNGSNIPSGDTSTPEKGKSGSYSLYITEDELRLLPADLLESVKKDGIRLSKENMARLPELPKTRLRRLKRESQN